MSKKKLTAKRKKQLLTMFAVAGVMGNTGIAPTMALADTLTQTAETATEQTQANEAKEVIDQTIQNVTDPLVNPTDSTTTTSDSLATTDEATDDTQDQATAATAESEGDATNPTAEAPKVAQKANVAAASKITGTWGTSPYTFDENTGVLTIGAGELSGYKESPWYGNKKVDPKAIKKIVLSGKVVAPKDSERLFCNVNFNNLTEIEGLSQLDTSNVTSMVSMFSTLSSLTSLDVSGFDTSNVTTMENMFYDISSIKSLDVSGFDTSNVTNMKSMFQSLSSLTSLDVSGFDTNKVTDMTKMFSGLSSVTSLDVSGFDTSNVTNMSNMFSGLSNLTSLDVSSFDTSNVTTMGYMFGDMSNITSLDVSGFDTSNVTTMSNMFYNMKSVTSLDVSSFDTSNVTTMFAMFAGMSSVTSLDVSSFDTSKVTTMSYMFDDMSNITSLDVSGFDTSKVTTMSYMFADTSPKKLILGDTFKFVEKNGSYAGLTSAWKREDGKGKAYTAKDFMKNYGTGDLTAGTYVSATGLWGTSPYNFDENTGTLTIEAGELSGYEESPWNSGTVDIEAIKKIVLSGKVVAPENSFLLFSGNTSADKPTNVTEIEGLSQLDTSNVTDMSKMFKGMSSITSLDVSGFDTSKVTNMQHMFSGMSSVTSLDVSGFDTSNVTDMANMFRGMSSVTSLDVSGFDTSNVTTMENMFYNISSVTSLDLSVFDTSNVTTMQDMFKDTPLAKLTLGDHFKAVGDTGLSAPKALNDGDQLTGNWIREDGQSKGYSPADFMTNYGTGDLTAGTYVAELVKSELKPQEYHVGDVNITGTYTGDMSLGRLTVNGKVVSWGGSFKDGQFSYYVGVGKLKVGDKVVLDGYNKEKELIDSKEIEVISESSGSIDQVDTYKLGDSTITGSYTGDIHKGKLVVNGEVVSWGGTYKDGKFSYYVNSQIIKAGDQATIQGYDKFDTPLGDPQPVTIGEQLGQLTEAHRVGISTVIEGNYTGDVYQGILLVNGEKVSQGGSFKDGKFSYYVGNLKVSEDDQVVLMGANNRGQQIPGSEIDVTIQTPTAEINELTYKLGTQTIKGAYGSDTQVHQGHLFVNGKLISKGGSFKDGAISYYVKPDLIKADDQVTMNFYDGSGNLLAENQTVSVN
ncbi:BspA family leucine-rich repeat surface protein [Enterococcus hirae]|uniref:BspA family leucine-rich repeat surface protein n=1 Tax=Enterococcus hirae TaxID=1354 RepID=UPI0015F2A091|nr:BspA family leucine-rich repeat surface protein [Enterococcus hirae]EMF0157438.1 BspA family leucine-rich repeat surface protein [Enterococcus hirae]MBA5257802.1 BspA family leucine-rich repeat surface protein [Enterococcus hirae]MBA5277785.1 BspA family leucine-rich repeat surface protein [Enterococcus hirae]MCO5489978.1 BspA family leucine-rich repeat surface protein [Enterococcus hirae]